MGNNILIRLGNVYTQSLWETFTIKIKPLRLSKLWIPKERFSSETLFKANKANKGTIAHPSYRNSVEKSLQKLKHIHRHVTLFKLSLWVSVIQTNELQSTPEAMLHCALNSYCGCELCHYQQQLVYPDTKDFNFQSTVTLCVAEFPLAVHGGNTDRILFSLFASHKKIK